MTRGSAPSRPPSQRSLLLRRIWSWLKAPPSLSYTTCVVAMFGIASVWLFRQRRYDLVALCMLNVVLGLIILLRDWRYWRKPDNR